MAVDDVTECSIIGTHYGQPIVMVLHYKTLTSFGVKQQEYAGLIDALEEFLFFKTITTDVLDVQTTGMTYTEIKLRDVVDDTLGLDHFINPVQTGTLVSDILPQQVCCLIQKKTDKIGRSFSGRTYLFGQTEATQSAGVFNQAYLDDVAAWYAQMLAINNFLVTFTFQMVVYSKLLGVSNAVTSFGVGQRSRTQKRRNL